MWEKLKESYPQLESVEEMPTIGDLQLQVAKAEKTWNAKQEYAWGKAKERFLIFIGMMNDHGYLLSVIPDGDKYTSLFTGVVKSVVHVSSNYRKIAEGSSLALVEMSDDLRFVKRSSRVSQSFEMKTLIVRLYVEVFKFLCHAMEFYSSKKNRLRVFFNQNFYDDKVQQMVNSIQRTVSLVCRESELVTQERAEQTGEQLSKMEDHILGLKIAAKDMRSGGNKEIYRKLDLLLVLSQQQLRVSTPGTRSWSGEANLEIFAGFPSEFPPETITDDLAGESRELDVPSSGLLLDAPASPMDARSISPSPLNNNGACRRYTRHEIKRHTKFLDAVVDDGRGGVENAVGFSKATLLAEFVERIQQWIQVAQSKFLWAKGPDLVSDLSVTALSISNVSMTAGIPCISFFCKRRFATSSPMEVLLFSLIKQLISILPPNFSSERNLEEDNFFEIQSTELSGADRRNHALELISALMAHAPLSFLVILDGLQFIYDRSDVPCLERLVELFRNTGPERLVKVLFTTSGNSLALSRSIRITEQVDALRIAQGAGKLIRGAAANSTLRHAKEKTREY